jgi:hypothetical protein
MRTKPKAKPATKPTKATKAPSKKRSPATEYTVQLGRELKAAHKAGRPIAVIAPDFGMSVSTLYKLVKEHNLWTTRSKTTNASASA